MALTPQDVSRIAHLARLELSAAEQASLLAQLNGFFVIVEQMSASSKPAHCACAICSCSARMLAPRRLL